MRLKLLIVTGLLAAAGCSTPPTRNTRVADYRNGKQNALVCPDNGTCFECDHATARRYERRYAEGKWSGGIVYLPVDVDNYSNQKYNETIWPFVPEP